MHDQERTREAGHKARQTPQAVERADDAAAVALFKAYGLRVDREVVQVGHDAQQEQHGGQSARRGHEADADQAERVKQGHAQQHGAAGIFLYQIAGKGHRNQLPEREEEQDGAQPRVAELQGLLDVRNPRRPRGEHRALQKEKEAYGGPICFYLEAVCPGM